MKQCITCGMPLMKKEDFALQNINSSICIYCADENWKIKPVEQIFEWWVQFFINATWASRIEAEKIVRKNMNKLLYWQNKDCKILKWEEATNEEFMDALNKLV